MSISVEELKRRHAILRKVAGAGGTLAEAAKELGLCEPYVRQMSYDARARFKRKVPAVKQHQVRCVEMVRAGDTCATVSQEVGVHANTIRRWAKLAGVKPTKGRGVQQPTVALDVIADLFHHPERSDTEIARGVGCSRERVGQLRAWMRDKDIRKSEPSK
jgi:LysM repeat protein